MEELKMGGQPAPKQSFTMPYVLFGTVVVLIAIALYVFFTLVLDVQQQQNRIRHEQAASAIRGYKNRAVLCDMIKGLGLKESKECSESIIQPYRDPEAGVSSSTGAKSSIVTMKAVCGLANKLDVHIAECPS